MRRILSGLLWLLLLTGALYGAERALDAQFERASASERPVRIQVAPGVTLRSILARLQTQGALRSARLTEWYLRWHGGAPRVQAGLYEIAPHASARAVLEQFAAGRVVLSALTVVEGWNFAQLRRALDADGDIQHLLRGQSDERLMQALGHAQQPPEGRFFPDTYRFAAGTSDKRILKQAYARMQSELAQAWAGRAADLPLENADQALIMASIIEKETAREDERARVAAVFDNRLRRGMRLQSDPTVIYGLGERYDGNIHTRDLETDTPYNTYTRAGLPPTPVALPGAASLTATLHPADSDALYFVATGNGDGSHHFSATLEEHDAAVRAYLRKIGVTPNVSASTPGATASGAAAPAASAEGAPPKAPQR